MTVFTDNPRQEVTLEEQGRPWPVPLSHRRGKAALLKLASDWAIVGDDEPIALADGPAIKAIRAESDPRKALMLWVQTVTEVAARTTPLGEVLTAAADTVLRGLFGAAVLGSVGGTGAAV